MSRELPEVYSCTCVLLACPPFVQVFFKHTINEALYEQRPLNTSVTVKVWFCYIYWPLSVHTGGHICLWFVTFFTSLGFRVELDEVTLYLPVFISTLTQARALTGILFGGSS